MQRKLIAAVIILNLGSSSLLSGSQPPCAPAETTDLLNLAKSSLALARSIFYDGQRARSNSNSFLADMIEGWKAQKELWEKDDKAQPVDLQARINALQKSRLEFLDQDILLLQRIIMSNTEKMNRWTQDLTKQFNSIMTDTDALIATAAASTQESATAAAKK